jgi:hypothetical protein
VVLAHLVAPATIRIRAGIDVYATLRARDEGPIARTARRRP